MRWLKLIEADIADERGDWLKAAFIRQQCTIPRVYDLALEFNYIESLRLPTEFIWSVNKMSFAQSNKNAILFDQGYLRKVKCSLQAFLDNIGLFGEVDQVEILDKVPLVFSAYPEYTVGATYPWDLPQYIWDRLRYIRIVGQTKVCTKWALGQALMEMAGSYD